MRLQAMLKRANDVRAAVLKRGVHMGRKPKLTELQRQKESQQRHGYYKLLSTVPGDKAYPPLSASVGFCAGRASRLRQDTARCTR